MTEATPTPSRPVERRFGDKPKVPHTAHLREFKMPDGRPLLVDRRALAFIVAAADRPSEHTIMAFRTNAKACPFGPAAAGNGKAA